MIDNAFFETKTGFIICITFFLLSLGSNLLILIISKMNILIFSKTLTENQTKNYYNFLNVHHLLLKRISNPTFLLSLAKKTKHLIGMNTSYSFLGKLIRNKCYSKSRFHASYIRSLQKFRFYKPSVYLVN